MDFQQLMQRRQLCLLKMHKAFAKYNYWINVLQQTESLMAQHQPFLEFNPTTQMNPYVNVSPYTQVNPHLNVSPFTQVNASVEVNPMTQINPKLFSDIEVSPTTQAYINLDPDIYLKFGK